MGADRITSFADAAQQTQIVLIGDTDHRKAEGFDAEISSEFAQLSEVGVKHYFVESSTYSQFAIDTYYDHLDGNITLEEFKEKILANEETSPAKDARYPKHSGTYVPEDDFSFLDFMKEAHAHGIQVHAVDDIPPPLFEAAADKYIPLLEAAAKEGGADTAKAEMLLEEKVNQLPEAQRQEATDFFDRLEQSRIDVNHRVAQRVHEIAGNDKAIIEFGFGHMDSIFDLNEMIETEYGHRNTMVIAVDHDGTGLQYYNAKGEFEKEDLPEYVYTRPLGHQDNAFEALDLNEIPKDMNLEVLNIDASDAPSPLNAGDKDRDSSLPDR